MFDKYPKERTELTPEFRKIYNEYYKNNRDGKTAVTSISQKMESWLHTKVAADVTKDHNKSTLEIGAGTLNQLKYENTTPYDIIEPFSDLYEKSPYRSRIRNIYNDIKEVDPSIKYDRIISIATFEHILNLPEVVAKSTLLLNKNGTFRVAIPNEGTILWKLGWKLTTGIEFKIKYGLNYKFLMQHEHVNTADEIEEVLSYFFRKCKCSSFGLSKKFAFYRFYECSDPDIIKAKEYLLENSNISDISYSK